MIARKFNDEIDPITINEAGILLPRPTLPDFCIIPVILTGKPLCYTQLKDVILIPQYPEKIETNT